MTADADAVVFVSPSEAQSLIHQAAEAGSTLPTESYSHPANLFWTPRTPLLGPFKNRTEALQAERGWLVTYQHGIALTACKVVPTKDDPQADHAIAGRAARGWKAPSAPTALASRSVLAR